MDSYVAWASTVFTVMGAGLEFLPLAHKCYGYRQPRFFAYLVKVMAKFGYHLSTLVHMAEYRKSPYSAKICGLYKPGASCPQWL